MRVRGWVTLHLSLPLPAHIPPVRAGLGPVRGKGILALDRLGANPCLPEEMKVGGSENTQRGTKAGIIIIHQTPGAGGGAGASHWGGGERVSWEGRGGFRLGFSHSLLSPQAWAFLRCEPGGGCIRAELAEGEVCLACAQGPHSLEWKGVCLGTPPPHCSSQGHFQGKCPKNRGQPGIGSGPGTPWRSELARDCPAETGPRLPSVGMGSGVRLRPSTATSHTSHQSLHAQAACDPHSPTR